MSKAGFWLRGSKGKLAGATLYQSNGETIMREVVSPSNPKTDGQLLQRIVMHTVMGAYSAMKAICDHSFEGIKKGQNTMSYFMKQNVQFCREKIATMQQQGTTVYGMYNFAPLGIKGFTPNQYQVAMGSLPQITSYIKDDTTQYGYIAGFAANTYADVIKTLGLKRGDQLTFCIFQELSSAYGAKEFKFARVILDPTNADGTPADLSVAFIGANGKINLPSIRNEGNFYFSYNESNQVLFGVSSGVGGPANFVIASRKGSDGNWMRSTTYMSYIESGISYNLGECLDMAKNGNTGLYVNNPLYLNNAGEGDGSTTAIDPGEEGAAGAAQISSVTVNGLSVTAGTQQSVMLANGTTFPTNVTVVVNAANADGKTIAILQGSTERATGVITNGQASITLNASSGSVYTIAWSEDDENVETSYRFTVAANSTPGGGSNDDGGGQN